MNRSIFLEVSKMTPSRMIEFSFAVITAFLLITLISFLTLRPILDETRAEARAEWDKYIQALRERNEIVPGITEAIKHFEPGYGKLLEGIMESRSVMMRSLDQETVISAADDLERRLQQIDKLARSRSTMDYHPTFSANWREINSLSAKIQILRNRYNSAVRLYNMLLKPFPQNIAVSLFGFAPMKEYQQASM